MTHVQNSGPNNIVLDDNLFWLPQSIPDFFAFGYWGLNEWQIENNPGSVTNRVSNNLSHRMVNPRLFEFKIMPVIFYRNTLDTSLEVRFRHGKSHRVIENVALNGAEYNFRDQGTWILNNRGGTIKLNEGNMTLRAYPTPRGGSGNRSWGRFWTEEKIPKGGANRVACFEFRVGGNSGNVDVGVPDGIGHCPCQNNWVAGNASQNLHSGTQRDTRTTGSIPDAALDLARALSAKSPERVGTRRGTAD